MAQPSRRDKSAENGEVASVPLTVVPIEDDMDGDALDGFKPEQAARIPPRRRLRRSRNAFRHGRKSTAASVDYHDRGGAHRGGRERWCVCQFRTQKAAPSAAAIATGKAILQTRPDRRDSAR